MQRSIHTILAPSNLGLRPLRPGHVPGAWRAPDALIEAGLRSAVQSTSETVMTRPPYSPEAVEGTRLRNGVEMRRFNLELAEHVSAAFDRNAFSLVIGGDCSILLGCLAGIRKSTPLSLLHIDGHSDFRHPGNYDPSVTLGAAAGMDLALATGRGEALMTEWPGVTGPLLQDQCVVQLGERETLDKDWVWPDVLDTEITVIDVHEAVAQGSSKTIGKIEAILQRGADRPIWLHLDVDVMDQAIMPAVDSPGSPGLSPEFLVSVCRHVLTHHPCAGMTVTVFDPDLDPAGEYASLIVKLLKDVFATV